MEERKMTIKETRKENRWGDDERESEGNGRMREKKESLMVVRVDRFLGNKK